MLSRAFTRVEKFVRCCSEGCDLDNVSVASNETIHARTKYMDNIFEFDHVEYIDPKTYSVGYDYETLEKEAVLDNYIRSTYTTPNELRLEEKIGEAITTGYLLDMRDDLVANIKLQRTRKAYAETDTRNHIICNKKPLLVHNYSYKVANLDIPSNSLLFMKSLDYANYTPLMSHRALFLAYCHWETETSPCTNVRCTFKHLYSKFGDHSYVLEHSWDSTFKSRIQEFGYTEEHIKNVITGHVYGNELLGNVAVLKHIKATDPKMLAFIKKTNKDYYQIIQARETSIRNRIVRIPSSIAPIQSHVINISGFTFRSIHELFTFLFSGHVFISCISRTVFYNFCPYETKSVPCKNICCLSKHVYSYSECTELKLFTKSIYLPNNVQTNMETMKKLQFSKEGLNIINDNIVNTPAYREMLKINIKFALVIMRRLRYHVDDISKSIKIHTRQF